MPKRKLQKEDLVVLRYTTNVCFVEVVTTDQARKGIKSLSIDLGNATWSWSMDSNLLNPTRKIGGGGVCHRQSGPLGVIGVYDRKKITDLSVMVNDAERAVILQRAIRD